MYIYIYIYIYIYSIGHKKKRQGAKNSSAVSKHLGGFKLLFKAFFLQNIVVLSIFFEFIKQNCKNCPYLQATDFSTKRKKCLFFFLQNP